MTLTELLENKKEIKGQIANILAVAEQEERELTPEEQAKYDELVAKLDELESAIAEKENELRNVKVKTVAPEKRFNLINCINAQINNRSFNEFETEILNAGRNEMSKAGLPTQGNIVLPMNYRASIQATVNAAGGYNVETDKLGILPKLRNKLVLVQAGAQFMTGLVGNVSIPVYGGSSVGWAGEITEAVDAGGTFTEVTYSPKRLSANLKISK
jgi:HK97 family phage major capsid protein